jgi:potassium efflux system protein
MNWTLSNPINRVVITVGIAYGSDTQKARELLLKVAQDQPFVLEDPAPLATFEGFGDNSLNFVLRSYLANFDNWVNNKTELHMAIDKAFREAGITIAFPQRDLHIRSVDESLGSILTPPEGQRSDLVVDPRNEKDEEDEKDQRT